MPLPMYRFWALVATGPPALQCVAAQHPFNDISLSVASNIRFLWFSAGLQVVPSYASADGSMPTPLHYRSACLTMPAHAPSIHSYFPQFWAKNMSFACLGVSGQCFHVLVMPYQYCPFIYTGAANRLMPASETCIYPSLPQFCVKNYVPRAI